jgi:hypothetical protein
MAKPIRPRLVLFGYVPLTGVIVLLAFCGIALFYLLLFLGVLLKP